VKSEQTKATYVLWDELKALKRQRKLQTDKESHRDRRAKCWQRIRLREKEKTHVVAGETHVVDESSHVVSENIHVEDWKDQ
jgi:hypothetical protein